ncbi:hypothetical protein [Aestuariivivens sp. NBU2969]|uniref:hypothetical protein n=1 Tax=Aestuariivivens sp. NBU2969 TaxID=2873267 RepID=UPI001CC00FA9|nr:hypothetical protein [Aestuariivivens sp. NBU2969]
MKRTLLFFTVLLIGVTTVSALSTHNDDVGKFNRFTEPIIFMERGIEFLIFPDGSFDFDTNVYNHYNDDIYYKSNINRSHVNVSYRGPNISIGYSYNKNRNNGIYISRDRYGNVRRIGNVFINYDRWGKVTRVGSVFIKYGRGRNATVTQVGGLRVNYNHWGEIVNVRGYVNRYNDDYCNICGVTSCTMSHGYNVHKHDHNDWYDKTHDDSYYYYKRNGKVKKQKKMKR